MKFSQSCVQFGGGRMGRVWVSALSEYFESIALVDPDPEVATAVAGTKAHYFNLNVLDDAEVNNSFNEQLRDYLREATVWSLAVRPDAHEKLIQLALDEDIRGLIVEKPVCSDIDKLEQFAKQAEENGLVTGVDYIELVHPAYETILKQAVEERFVPGRGFHWRGKDLRYQVDDGKKHEGGVPFMKDDLCHDVSEVYGLYRELADIDGSESLDPELTVKSVDELKLWSDAEYQEAYPFRGFTHDISAEITIAGPNDAEFTFRGGYDEEDERRFFLWVGEDERTAYYGNTLQREFTTPAAYKIVGTENIREAERELKSGDIVTKSEETELMHRVNAKPLAFPQTAYSERVTRMARRIFSQSPPATLSDAVRIERLVDNAYKMSPHPDASEY